jgi:type I restriction enzyme S subunit
MQLTVDSAQLPVGWKVKTLDELCEIARGGSPRPIKQFLTHSPDGVNWIKISDASASSKYIYQTKEKIKPDGIKYSRLVSEGDFILSNSMSFGRPYIMRTSGCIHDGWLVLKDKSGLFDQDYLYYFLGSNTTYKQFDKLAAGSTVRNLNIDLVRGVKVILPPLAEQKRIVTILEEAFEGIDRAIANTEKNLANSRELFESYLKAIFTQKGDGWVEKKLGDVCNFSQGIQVETKLQLETMNHDGLVRFLRIVDFTQGNEALRYIENPGIKYIVNERDVSLVRYGASTGFVCRGLNGAIANNLFKVLPKQNNLTNEYIYYFLCSSTFQNEIKRVMGGAAMPAISFGLIKNIKMLIPSLSDQEAVVRRLDLFNIQTQRLETIYRQKIAALKELKQSILQKVFTGELTADTPKTVKEEIAA